MTGTFRSKLAVAAIGAAIATALPSVRPAYTAVQDNHSNHGTQLITEEKELLADASYKGENYRITIVLVYNGRTEDCIPVIKKLVGKPPRGEEISDALYDQIIGTLRSDIILMCKETRVFNIINDLQKENVIDGAARVNEVITEAGRNGIEEPLARRFIEDLKTLGAVKAVKREGLELLTTAEHVEKQ